MYDIFRVDWRRIIEYDGDIGWKFVVYMEFKVDVYSIFIYGKDVSVYINIMDKRLLCKHH